MGNKSSRPTTSEAQTQTKDETAAPEVARVPGEDNLVDTAAATTENDLPDTSENVLQNLEQDLLGERSGAVSHDDGLDDMDRELPGERSSLSGHVDGLDDKDRDLLGEQSSLSSSDDGLDDIDRMLLGEEPRQRSHHDKSDGQLDRPQQRAYSAQRNSSAANANRSESRADQREDSVINSVEEIAKEGAVGDSEDPCDDEQDTDKQQGALYTTTIGKEEAAVFAWSIRDKLREQGLRDAGGEYANNPEPPKKGDFKWDFTAPCPGQLDLSEPTDDERHPALKVYRPTTTKDDVPRPGLLMYKGKVVVNIERKPLKDLQHCPLTLASNVEGFRLVACYNMNPSITFRDFQDRLPVRLTTGPEGETTRKPAFGTNTLNGRMGHARDSLCIRPRKEHSGSSTITAAMDNFRTQEQREANEAPARLLTRTEIDQVHSSNIGQFPSKKRKGRVEDHNESNDGSEDGEAKRQKLDPVDVERDSTEPQEDDSAPEPCERGEDIDSSSASETACMQAGSA